MTARPNCPHAGAWIPRAGSPAPEVAAEGQDTMVNAMLVALEPWQFHLLALQ